MDHLSACGKCFSVTSVDFFANRDPSAAFQMPVTPDFSIRQDDEFVYVVIKVPFIRIKDTEILTDGGNFTFYCKPYLLKLCFPHELEDCDDERCRAVYDPNVDNGIITAHLAKKERGRHFADLDLTTRLLATRKSNDKKLYSKDSDLLPSIEVMSSSFDVSGSIDDMSESTPSTDTFGILDELRLTNAPKYGFNLQYSNILGNQKVTLLLAISLQMKST